MLAYIDESGDLGWTLEKPYRAGGSSRYLTIAILLIPNQIRHIPKRIVKALYTKYKIPTKKEIKGCDLNDDQRTYFIQKVLDCMKAHPEIRIISITVKKENVQAHIRKDSNKLYNFMIRLALLSEISKENIVELLPDPRSIKVRSGNSLLDYLQTELWFEDKASTVLTHRIMPSNSNLNLIFIDIITNIIWCKYENDKRRNANLLMPHVINHELFFDRI